MKLFRYDGEGCALGAEIIAIAKDEASARRVIKKKLIQDFHFSGGMISLNKKGQIDIRFVRDVDLEKASVVHAWDGDY